MQSIRHLAFLAALAGLTVLAGTTVRADDEDGIPSFKTSTKRETKEFVTRVGSAVIKAARAKPQKIELDKYEYTNPKAGRSELSIKMHYHGFATKQKYTADIKVIIDSAEKEKWEVLNIEYKDTSKSLLNPSEKSIQALIKKLNR